MANGSPPTANPSIEKERKNIPSTGKELKQSKKIPGLV